MLQAFTKNFEEFFLFLETHISWLVNHAMVENTKTWIFWERSITFPQHKKILNLCFRYHILRSNCFVVEVTFKQSVSVVLDYLHTRLHECRTQSIFPTGFPYFILDMWNTIFHTWYFILDIHISFYNSPISYYSDLNSCFGYF